jgi:hypothetical protein
MSARCVVKKVVHHRTTTKWIRQVLGFKSPASTTPEGIEVASMIHKNQMEPRVWLFAQFAALAA